MRTVFLGCLVMTAAVTSSLEAQGKSLHEKLDGLFTFGVCGRPLCLDGSVNAANGHGDHFLPDLAAGNAAILSFITGSIASNTGSVPATASSGGETYRFEGGIPVKTSESVGPIFSERAHTLGRGRLFVGTRYTTETLQTLRNVPINDLILNFTHQDVSPAGLGDPVLENDILETRLSLNLGLDVTSFFATYGVTDNFDISVVVPVVHTTMQASAAAQIFPFGATAVHFFSGTPDNPVLQANSAAFGSHTGLGDVAFRAKANLLTTDRYSVAVVGDMRLATGDEDNFAGAGASSVRALMVGSARYGAFSPHLNLGYQLRGGKEANDVFLATGGFDQMLSGWATLAVELVSELQVGANKTILPGTVTYEFPFKRTIESTNIPDTKDHRVLGSVGAKFRTSPHGPIIITDMLVPIKRGGLQPTVMWTVGLDMGF